MLSVADVVRDRDIKRTKMEVDPAGPVPPQFLRHAQARVKALAIAMHEARCRAP